MKRAYKGIFSILFVISLLFSVSLISAQNVFIEQFYNTVGPAIGSIFGPIFGHDAYDDFLWAKILLFFLLFSVVFMILKRVPTFENNTIICSVLGIIVAILAVRYLEPNQFITAILLPYGGLGAAITVFLPFLIFFWFVHSALESTFARRAAWALYGAALLFLLFSRWSDLTVPDVGERGFNAQWVYLFGVILVIVAFFWDRAIHNQMRRAELFQAEEEVHERGRQEWINQLRLAEQNGDESRARRIRNVLRRRYGGY